MIKTQRLILRPHAPEDFEAMFAMSTDPVVMRFIRHGAQATRQDIWTKLLRNIGHWSAFGYGLFAVVEKSTGAYVGDTGLAIFHRGLGDDFDPYPEAAWVYALAAQGKGYATEAAIAAHDWLDARIGKGRRVCIIDAANIGSLAVARKLGYAPYGEVEYKGDPVVKLERSAAP